MSLFACVVSVEPVFRSTQEVLCVHATSTGEIDRVPCGTTIIAYVTKNMVTLEQHHTEYIKVTLKHAFYPSLCLFLQKYEAS